MFGKKKPDNSKQVEMNIHTQVIPAEFYAGLNPVVKFKEVKKEVVLNASGQVLTKSEQDMIKHAQVAGGNNKAHPANLLASKKFLIVAGVVIFVLCLIGGGVYYWLQMKAVAKPAPNPPAVSYVPPAPVVPSSTPVESTPIESVVSSTPLALQEPPIVFLPNTIGDSVDLDNDGMTDEAEKIFKTDPSVPDTDGDKYLDGSEVYHLYDPAKKTPAKLIDSGSIKEFDNPVFGYKVYYPATWEVGNVDQKYRQVLLSALNGENIEIRVFDLEANQTFADWFAKWAPSEQYASLVSVDSMFGDRGQGRPDDLVYYFTDSVGHVYVMVYHSLDANEPIRYRAISKMMARSFRLTGNYSTLPTQSSAEEMMPENAVAETGVVPSTTTSTL